MLYASPRNIAIMEGNKNIYVITPHVGKFELDSFLQEVNELRSLHWDYKVWKPTAALIDKSGTISQYTGQRYDPSLFVLDPAGWTHDHCEFCSHAISDIEGYGHLTGYGVHNYWLCNDCYNMMIVPKDIDGVLKNLQLEG